MIIEEYNLISFKLTSVINNLCYMGFWGFGVMVFWAYFCKMCVYIFLGVPGHFFNENAFMERDPRGIQKPTLELPTLRGTRDMAPSSFSFQWKVHGRADQKMRFPAILVLFQF